MFLASSIDSASSWLTSSNVIYVGGAVLTLAAAMHVRHEKRSVDAGKLSKVSFASEASVIAAAIVSLAGTCGAIYFGNLVGHLKDVDLATYKTGADIKIAQANSEAANANKEAGIAKENATDASAHLADANKQAAQANKKAAEANATAQEAVLDKTKILNDNLRLQQQMDQERSARQNIETNLAPRELSLAMQQLITSGLRTLPAQDIDIVFYPGNPEAEHLVMQIVYPFQLSNWKAYFYQPMGGSAQAVTIEYDAQNKDAAIIANTVLGALQRSNIRASASPNLPPFMQQFGAYTSGDGAKGTAKIRILVGSK